MPTPDEVPPGTLDDDYEEYIEFQCPLCQIPVSDKDDTCPGCGAIFVSQEQPVDDDLVDELEIEEDYELDEDLDYVEMDDAALEAEIAAMEAELADDQYAYTTPDGDWVEDEEDIVEEPFSEEDDLAPEAEVDHFDLYLGYEEDLEMEEEVEEAFGSAVKVSAEDHAHLEELSQPTLMERLFHRLGLGCFIAGGAAAVLIILWDPLHGQAMSLGVMQWRFMVLALGMFLSGFIVEMFQAFSMARDEDPFAVDLLSD